MVVASLRHICDRELTDDEEKKAIILGWCVEWLQAFFLVADDVMDESKTRRGQPCWYTKDGVGLEAVNDSFLIGVTTYRLLKKYFGEESYYVKILELFNEVSYQTAIGQTLDLMFSPHKDLDFTKFTLIRFKTIAKHKTAYYSFYLPVALAMHMAGVSDDKSHNIAKTILLAMGEFFQIQDDYLDCFGEPSITGKGGSDIEQSKCTWLIVQALDHVNDQQKDILKANYGKSDPVCVQKVKELYNELNLKELYHQYEESSYKQLMSLIENKVKETQLPPGMFQEFADKIYKRNK
ncbi:farnesyl pyrophosphate synthase-like [Gigantopelta aegis]|uniref:farnesyl pyrophosphate synthase-like n=1 Tax=Gigantopelta aegis TaxID=1735272 RepID=UPI001B88777B|nr:farnesyl pyrophosphate synthase-like [Gigantopelta aegis]